MDDSNRKRPRNEETTWAALFQMPDDGEYVDYTRDMRQILYRNADPLLLMQMASSDRRAYTLNHDDAFWKDFVERDFPVESKNRGLITFAQYVPLVIARMYDIDMGNADAHTQDIERFARQKIYLDRPWKQLYVALRQWYGQALVAASIPLWMVRPQDETTAVLTRFIAGVQQRANYTEMYAGPMKNTYKNRAILQDLMAIAPPRHNWNRRIRKGRFTQGRMIWKEYYSDILDILWELQPMPSLPKRGNQTTEPTQFILDFAVTVMYPYSTIEGESTFYKLPKTNMVENANVIGDLLFQVYGNTPYRPLQEKLLSSAGFGRVDYAAALPRMTQLVPNKNEQTPGVLQWEKLKAFKRAMSLYLPVIESADLKLLYMNAQICNVCKQQKERMYLCGECKDVVYCSQECAIGDYASHEPHCVKREM